MLGFCIVNAATCCVNLAICSFSSFTSVGLDIIAAVVWALLLLMVISRQARSTNFISGRCTREKQYLLLHDLKQLLGQVMPKLEANAQEQLLLHQFLAGLRESVSSQLQATGETKSLEDMVERYEFCWCHCGH